MSTAVVAASEGRAISRRVLAPIAILAVLFTVPFWLPLLGGYTALAARVLVFGLAAMGLNMLLGFTGVLSFGHAAYFGLGAYGAGLTLRYLAHSTPAAIVAGTLLGGLAGTLFGLLIVCDGAACISRCARSLSDSFGTISPIAGIALPVVSTVCAISIAKRSD
jgi:hypothetical protein